MSSEVQAVEEAIQKLTALKAVAVNVAEAQKKVAEATQRVHDLEVAIKDKQNESNRASQSLGEINRQIAEKQATFASLSKEVERLYGERSSEEGKLRVARQHLQEIVEKIK